MTLFGQTFDAQQIFGLVSLLSMLVLWIFVFRSQRQHARWFKQWEADRKARRDAELAREADQAAPQDRRGPWG